MKTLDKPLLVFCVITILLSSCQFAGLSGTPTASMTPSATATAAPATITITSTLSKTPSATETPAPTGTITPTNTPILLPLTPAPTFNVKTIRTITPAQLTACHKENLSVVPNFTQPGYIGTDKLLNYLNAGGILDKLVGGEDKRIKPENILDLTGEGIKEVLYDTLAGYPIVLGCKDGTYQKLFEFSTEAESWWSFEETVDLNQNGIPELIFTAFNHNGYGLVYMYEWDGTAFRSVIKVQPDPYRLTKTEDTIQFFADPYQIMDTNGDGLKELVLVNNPPFSYTDGYIPYYRTTLLGWDGENFVNLKPGLFAPPQYRFQAVQFGDMQTLYGNYSDAIRNYEAAIFNDQLEWWSFDRQFYISQHDYQGKTDLTPPSPNLTERPKLAAYAYYRLMILHVYLNKMPAAQAYYTALKTKFPAENPGYPYAEMATAFWDAYQSTQNISAACDAAYRRYVIFHDEILELFEYRGWWSHDYKSEDFCPF